jgi:hypothetical protein
LEVQSLISKNPTDQHAQWYPMMEILAKMMWKNRVRTSPFLLFSVTCMVNRLPKCQEKSKSIKKHAIPSHKLACRNQEKEVYVAMATPAPAKRKISKGQLKCKRNQNQSQNIHKITTM